jgi:hypothetical protein
MYLTNHVSFHAKMQQWFLQHVAGNCNGIFFSGAEAASILMLPVHHTRLPLQSACKFIC